MPSRRRLARSNNMHVVAVALLVTTTLLAVRVDAAGTPTDNCCAVCIGKTSSIPYTYDPLVYAQCNAVKGVCCFNCNSDSASNPTVENGDFGSDGVTPQVKAGAWIQLTWSNIARVTYESYQVNQVKTTTVRNGSAEATKEDDVFFICAKNQGKVVVRGWGTDPCTTATTEYTIEVVAGTSTNGTCAERTPTAPTTTKAASASKAGSTSSTSTVDEDPNIAQCNPQRASVVERNGKKVCECAAEWTGPPDCGGYPWWKTAATIGGGIAAVLSIIVSVRAFMNSRKAKEAEKEEKALGDPVLGEESITIAGAPVLSNRSSDPAYGVPPVTAKAKDHKEYSL